MVLFIILSDDDPSFEYISSTMTSELQTSSNMMGHWKSKGNVVIVHTGEKLLPYPNPEGLKYSCLLETHKDVNYSHISMTFNNVVKGACYSVSFYDTVLSGSKAPHEFKVILSADVVYETIPTTADKWGKVVTDTYCVQSNHLHLQIQVSSIDKSYRAIAINDVHLILKGIYKLSEL